MPYSTKQHQAVQAVSPRASRQRSTAWCCFVLYGIPCPLNMRMKIIFIL